MASSSLYRKALRTDKELASIKDRDRPEHEGRIKEGRSSIKKSLEEILLSDLEYSITKDVCALLWKSVFYAEIGAFRKRISKYTQREREEKEKEKEYAARVRNLKEEFCTFLTESIDYYEGLLGRLQRHYHPEDPKHAPEVQNMMAEVFHLSLIYAGDLARYRACYAIGELGRDWKPSSSYYCQALVICPSAGLPHNQLAVLATYQNSDFRAAYHYFRALASSKPFLNARENLITLFEKNRKMITARLGRTERDYMRRRTNPRMDMHNPEEAVQEFTMRFMRCHGILFTKTGCELFNVVLVDTMRHLEVLLSSSVLVEEFLMRIMLMNIVGYELVSFKGGTVRHTDSDATQGSVLKRLANEQAWGCFALMLDCIPNAGLIEYLGPLGAFFSWLKCNPSLLQPLNGTGSNASGMSPEAILEVATKFLQRIPSLKELDGLDHSSLPEDIELAGFCYLSNSLPKVTQSSPQGDFNALTAERLKRIRLVADWLVENGHISYDATSGQYHTKTAESAPKREYEEEPDTIPHPNPVQTPPTMGEAFVPSTDQIPHETFQNRDSNQEDDHGPSSSDPDSDLDHDPVPAPVEVPVPADPAKEPSTTQPSRQEKDQDVEDFEDEMEGEDIVFSGFGMEEPNPNRDPMEGPQTSSPQPQEPLPETEQPQPDTTASEPFGMDFNRRKQNGVEFPTMMGIMGSTHSFLDPPVQGAFSLFGQDSSTMGPIKEEYDTAAINRPNAMFHTHHYEAMSHTPHYDTSPRSMLDTLRFNGTSDGYVFPVAHPFASSSRGSSPAQAGTAWTTEPSPVQHPFATSSPHTGRGASPVPHPFANSSPTYIPTSAHEVANQNSAEPDSQVVAEMLQVALGSPPKGPETYDPAIVNAYQYANPQRAPYMDKLYGTDNDHAGSVTSVAHPFINRNQTTHGTAPQNGWPK